MSPIYCEKCRSTGSSCVSDSRVRGSYRYRRYRCLACGEKWSTKEFRARGNLRGRDPVLTINKDLDADDPFAQAIAKAKVEVQKRLDGSIHIFYQGEELNYKLISVQEKRYVSSKDNALVMAGV